MKEKSLEIKLCENYRSKVAIAVFPDRTIALYDDWPVGPGLGRGEDMVALYKNQDGTRATYVFSLERGHGSTSPKFTEKELFEEREPDADRRLHYFIVFEGCNLDTMKKKSEQFITSRGMNIAVRLGGNWIPYSTTIARKHMEEESEGYLAIYDATEEGIFKKLNQALEKEPMLHNQWKAQAERYGCNGF